MRCLLRTVNRRRKGVVVYQDRELSGDPLSIGRAAGQDLYLPDLRVALHHANIVSSGADKFLIQSTVPSGIRHNEKTVQSALLEVGDRIGIGNCQITVAPAGGGYDLVLEVKHGTQDNDLERAPLSPGGNRAPARLSLRTWAWLLFGSILVLFLVVPIAGFTIPALGNFLRSIAPPISDSAWDPGSLNRGHRFFGDDCNACHRSAFFSVRNDACLACHKSAPHHVDIQAFPLPSLTEGRCASCHKEHHGAEWFVRQDEDLCLDCHEEIKSVAEDSKLLDVPGNVGEGHPELRATLITHAAGKEQSKRVSLDRKAELKERSNLYFPHKTHLDRQGIISPDGEVVLSCASCHAPDPGGRRMAPIHFEEHCHRCHKLTFEFDDPRREVPHGNAPAVLEALKSYYALRTLEGAYLESDAAASPPSRQRPDERASTMLRREAMDRAASQAEVVGKELFEYRACATCHQIHAVAEPFTRWEIKPVRIAEAWFPKARFDHEQHKTIACKNCHAAARSEESEDVLVPGIQKCETCHGGLGAESRVESTCVSCHGFHVSKKYAMDGTVIRATAEKRRNRRESTPPPRDF